MVGMSGTARHGLSGRPGNTSGLPRPSAPHLLEDLQSTPAQRGPGARDSPSCVGPGCSMHPRPDRSLPRAPSDLARACRRQHEELEASWHPRAETMAPLCWIAMDADGERWMAGRRRRVIALEPSGELIELLLTLLRLELPSRPHRGQRLSLQLLRQVPHHVPGLVVPAPLDGMLAPEHLVERRPQRLRSVQHKQPPTPGVHTPHDQVLQQCTGHLGVLARSLDPIASVIRAGETSDRKPRPGNVSSADDWDELLVPEIERQQAQGKHVAFRADAAFARSAIYEALEARGVQYAIRIPANKNLELAVEDILFRSPGRPSLKPLVRYKSFQYQADTWTTPRRVVAKVEHYVGELFPRVGFIVTNLPAPQPCRRAVLQQARDGGAMDQGRQAGGALDAALVSSIPGE